MAVESFYFSHDYSARNDPKLQKVLMRLGQAGKGVYWDLIEMLYEEGGYLILSEIESYAFALRTDISCITQLINDFDLFQNNGEKFWSDSVLKRLFLRNEKSLKASKSASIRWKKHKQDANALESDANALQTECNSNAIKEKKGNKNEKKGNEKSDFEVSFDKYLLMRKKIKRPATDEAIRLAHEKLEKLSNGDENLKIKILEQSIMQSWQGLFELKEDFKNKITSPQNQNPSKVDTVINAFENLLKK